MNRREFEVSILLLGYKLVLGIGDSQFNYDSYEYNKRAIIISKGPITSIAFLSERVNDYPGANFHSNTFQDAFDYISTWEPSNDH